MLKKVVLCFFVALGVKSVSIAQTSSPAELSVYMEITSGSGNFGDTLIPSSAGLNGTMVIEVNNVIDISKIHVKMGSSDGSSDLFSKAFDFDVTSGLPTGISYRRENNVIYLGIGNYTGLNHFFAEAKLEDVQGSFSATVKYQQ